MISPGLAAVAMRTPATSDPASRLRPLPRWPRRSRCPWRRGQRPAQILPGTFRQDARNRHRPGRLAAAEGLCSPDTAAPRTGTQQRRMGPPASGADHVGIQATVLAARLDRHRVPTRTRLAGVVRRLRRDGLRRRRRPCRPPQYATARGARLPPVRTRRRAPRCATGLTVSVRRPRQWGTGPGRRPYGPAWAGTVARPGPARPGARR